MGPTQDIKRGDLRTSRESAQTPGGLTRARLIKMRAHEWDGAIPLGKGGIAPS